MRKLTSFITIISFFVYSTVIPSIAYAEDPPVQDPPTIERVTTLQLGDPAPFAGTLFSTTAAARLLTDLQFTQQQCQLETTRQLGLQEARLQLQIDTLTASRAALQLRYDETLVLKNNQITFLEEMLQIFQQSEITSISII